jgi:hypothetical protein
MTYFNIGAELRPHTVEEIGNALGILRRKFLSKGSLGTAARRGMDNSLLNPSGFFKYHQV